MDLQVLKANCEAAYDALDRLEGGDDIRSGAGAGHEAGGAAPAVSGSATKSVDEILAELHGYESAACERLVQLERASDLDSSVREAEIKHVAAALQVLTDGAARRAQRRAKASSRLLRFPPPLVVHVSLRTHKLAHGKFRWVVSVREPASDGPGPRGGDPCCSEASAAAHSHSHSSSSGGRIQRVRFTVQEADQQIQVEPAGFSLSMDWPCGTSCGVLVEIIPHDEGRGAPHAAAATNCTPSTMPVEILPHDEGQGAPHAAAVTNSTPSTTTTTVASAAAASAAEEDEAEAATTTTSVGAAGGATTNSASHPPQVRPFCVALTVCLGLLIEEKHTFYFDETRELVEKLHRKPVKSELYALMKQKGLKPWSLSEGLTVLPNGGVFPGTVSLNQCFWISVAHWLQLCVQQVMGLQELKTVASGSGNGTELKSSSSSSLPAPPPLPLRVPDSFTQTDLVTHQRALQHLAHQLGVLVRVYIYDHKRHALVTPGVPTAHRTELDMGSAQLLDKPERWVVLVHFGDHFELVLHAHQLGYNLPSLHFE